MIPIGAPVTATRRFNGGEDTFNGTLTDVLTEGKKRPVLVLNSVLWFIQTEVNIRYDNPAPFTLWQLNVLCGEKANNSWTNDEQYIDDDVYEKQWVDGAPFIGPHQISRYWDHFDRYIS